MRSIFIKGIVAIYGTVPQSVTQLQAVPLIRNYFKSEPFIPWGINHPKMPTILCEHNLLKVEKFNLIWLQAGNEFGRNWDYHI